MKTKQLTFLLALTFLFLFSGSVYGQEVVKKVHWDNGNLKREIHYKNNKEVLKRQYWENGNLNLEVHSKNGIKEGLGNEWYKTG